MRFIFEQVKSNCITWNYINLFYYNIYFRERGGGREWWEVMGKGGMMERGGSGGA